MTAEEIAREHQYRLWLAQFEREQIAGDHERRQRIQDAFDERVRAALRAEATPFEADPYSMDDL
jgi:hypothetical protein